MARELKFYYFSASVAGKKRILDGFAQEEEVGGCFPIASVIRTLAKDAKVLTCDIWFRCIQQISHAQLVKFKKHHETEHTND